MRWTILIMGFMLLIFGCAQDQMENPLDLQLQSRLKKTSKTGDMSYYQLPHSEDYASLPNQDPENLVTAEKVNLGKLLFFETGLGQDAKYDVALETYSCSSCHLPSAGFTPGRHQGIAEGGIGHGDIRQQWPIYQEEEMDVQGIRPLSVLNVSYVSNTLWNGQFGAGGVNTGTEYAWSNDSITLVNFEGFKGLECQNIEGLSLHRLNITDKVLDEYGYRSYFDAAFPDLPKSERYSKKAASFALSAYLRSLSTTEAPFQNWVRGDLNSMTDSEKRGALLFFNKARCFHCHSSPSLGSMSFQALGTKDLFETGAHATSSEDKKNLGRGAFTDRDEEMFCFKVPQLYNTGDYATYFHGSSKQTLREVVAFKIKAQSENPLVRTDQLSSLFKPLDLTEQEISDLVEFLENGLRDPDLNRFMPEEVLSGNCFPNNDNVARLQLGCN